MELTKSKPLPSVAVWWWHVYRGFKHCHTHRLQHLLQYSPSESPFLTFPQASIAPMKLTPPFVSRHSYSIFRTLCVLAPNTPTCPFASPDGVLAFPDVLLCG